MTLEDFARLKKGVIIHLYYNCVNEGDFFWKHSHVESDRVYGQFQYVEEGCVPDNDEWSEIDDYLYEFEGLVCRGSGAEPVFRTKRQADA